MTIRVMVVDDQAMVRAGFEALLAAQPDIEVVATAANGVEAVRLAREAQPDVVLMDIRMPVMDGLEATRSILSGADDSDDREGLPRVLVLTTFDLDEYVYDALRSGAGGFLLKDALPADLVHAVRVVAAGDALVAPSVMRRLVADFASRRTATATGARLDSLTEREREVLALVARGHSNREIADQLVLAEQTVKTHVSRMLTKLDLRDRAQAVVFAYENGVVSPGT